MHEPKVVLVTGGCGFIGSNFLNMVVPKNSDIQFINFDHLTYATDPGNVKEVENLVNYQFAYGDLGKDSDVDYIVQHFKPDTIINFAAESHVTRSINDPTIFVHTNIGGVSNLLNACRKHWRTYEGKLYYQISTDEVFGDGQIADENSTYNPSNPYAASKAAGDCMIKSYMRTYNFPAIISHATNNYGIKQHPEKFIPKMIYLALNNEEMTVHGDGSFVRDWTHVLDHCEAVWTLVNKAEIKTEWNISAYNYHSILEVAKLLGTYISELCDCDKPSIRLFTDPRPGCDIKYEVKSEKIRNTFGWLPLRDFETELKATVKWYIEKVKI